MDRSFEVYEGLAMSARTQEALRRRIDWICGQARGLVLDVGCSQGLVPYLLAQKRHTVVGVDIDAEAIAWAQNKFMHIDEEIRQRIHLYTVDFVDFQTEQRFDTVIAGEYLEHLNDEQLSVHLRKMALLLKPQGLFVCTTPLGLHPHPDHFQTFLPHSFAQKIGQFFSILFMDVEDGYLRNIGNTSTPPVLPDAETLLRLTEKGLLQVQASHSERSASPLPPLIAKAPAPKTDQQKRRMDKEVGLSENALANWLAKLGFKQPFHYDVHLFSALNEYYRDKPLVNLPRKLTPSSLFAQANKHVDELLNVQPAFDNLKCLEVGCGRGETAVCLSDKGQCHVTGVDIKQYTEWEERWSSRTKFLPIDITHKSPFQASSFDFIYSFVVFEHIVEPLAMLGTLYRLLKPGGTLYFTANLYRGPKASHRYREIFFPWPHLLFGNDVFMAYYREQKHKTTGRLPWINKLTSLHYIEEIKSLGFQIIKCDYIKTNIDIEFFNCFQYELSKYPYQDLERDFIRMYVKK